MAALNLEISETADFLIILLSGGVITHLFGTPGSNVHTVHPPGDTQVWRIGGVITNKEIVKVFGEKIMSLPNTYTLPLQRHRTSTVGLKYWSTLASKFPNDALTTRMLSTRKKTHRVCPMLRIGLLFSPIIFKCKSSETSPLMGLPSKFHSP